MNEDYLWDKTGSDSEIEGLEELFAPMRYRPSPPPELRAEKAVRFGWLTSWMTPAAGLLTAATLLFALGLGWQVSYRGGGDSNKAASVTPMAVRDDNPTTNEVAPGPPAQEAKAIEEIKPTRALHFPKPNRTRPVPAVVKSRKSRPKNNEVTKEEQEAYDQVLLALSIAGSKLKIVSEAANGAED